jgi:DNA-binding NarL/FixJ family response regulator
MDKLNELSELLRLTSVLVAIPRRADGPSDAACRREMARANAALRRAIRALRPRHSDLQQLEMPLPARRRALTPRERQVVCLLVKGAAYKDVAAQLGIAFSSVQSRVKEIYAKLGVHSKEELAQALRDPGEAPASPVYIGPR